MGMQGAVVDGWSFLASTPWGELRLVLPDAGADGRAATLQAAAALEAAEPRLQGLEDWLGRGLAPRPLLDESGQPRRRSAVPAAAAWACWKEAGAGTMHLALPLARLREWPAPPAVLQWQPIDCAWTLGSLEPDEDDRAALGPGAAVVLPLWPSGGWRGRLHALQEPAVHALVETQWDARRARVLGPAVDERLAALQLECVALAPLPVPADCLAGWRDDPFELPLRAPPVALQARRGGEAVRVGGGVLLPWFDTCALHLDQLDNDSWARAWT